ncbi:MAG: methyltransferase domain-containing protein [Bacteroidota bacterium]
MSSLHESVKQYYGSELSTTEDLKTDACCTLQEPPEHIKKALANVHDEVIAKYYGCGLTIPDQLDGLRVLDLGCGSGRDAYVLSQLVGPTGEVIGIDMTEEQVSIAHRYVDHHADKFGYKISNVKFLSGNIDQLEELDLPPESFDLIVSNCVINLVENKDKVLKDVYQLLKPGGEMYFSDVYCDRRIPQSLQEDRVLWGECLSGALYWNDFLRLSRQAGFTDPRAVESHPISIDNDEIAKTVGDHQFYSVTYRLFKIAGLEPDCEDYGQAVAYRGTISQVENNFVLDDHHEFPVGKVITVCGNTYRMLCDTRFHDHFDFYGTWDRHYGIFEGCGGAMPFGQSASDSDSSCC